METLSLVVYFLLGAVLAANWKKIKQHLPFISNLSKQRVSQVRILESGAREPKILNVLTTYKAGLTLKEISKEFGVHYIRLAQPIKNLIKSGKIEKKDNRYFCK